MSLGIKSSLNLSFNKTSLVQLDDELDFLTYELSFVEEDLSPSLGVFGLFENDLVFVRCDILYRQAKSRFRHVDYRNHEDLSPKTSLRLTRYIVSPIQMGLRLENFRFGAGPIFSYKLSRNNAFTEIDYLVEREKKLQGGWHLGLGIELNRLMVEIQYEQRFHGVADGLYYRGNPHPFDQTSRYVNLGLIYLIPINW